MQRFLVGLVVLLAGILLSRDAHVQKADQAFLDWLLRNTDPTPSKPLPLMVVEIGRSSQRTDKPAHPFIRGGSSEISPLEFALFFQAIIEYKPTILAIEPVLRWRERDRDQEQVFLDQAMRIPKLLLAAELTATPDPDIPPPEITGFTHVSGRRGDLPTFTGIAHQPDEDLRLISTLAFTNLPEEVSSETHVPLLFQYRGDVIPAFALQAFLTWARIPMSEVNVVLGSHIGLPDGRKIPIDSDGTLTVNPNAAKLGRHLNLNELLLLAQQRAKDSPLLQLPSDLLLARTPSIIKPDDPDQVREARSLGVLAAAIATLQSNRFIRRVSVVFDCVVLIGLAALASVASRVRQIDIILAAIALSAGYLLLAFGLVAHFGIFIPAVVPLSALWLLAIIALAAPRPKQHLAEPVEIVAAPPVP
ncbi:MAG: hypothetical protein JO354_12900 [Verrucomicrobia bacterium]|nr:hypothetical protein [Verrucomicrobiota bacterium]